MDALEARLGVKLFVRTTRKLTLTFEGSAFLEDCQRVLNDFHDAEASVSLGGVKASGHVRLTAPAGFGRRHVAPLIPGFCQSNPDVSVSLELSDGLSDIVTEGFDLAIRLGNLDDSNLVSVRLANNRRVVVANPDYLREHGEPASPDDLVKHNCLTFGTYGNQARGWQFQVDGELRSVRTNGLMQTNDGSVLRDWSLAGAGLAWRSLWEVGDDIAAGRLVTVLTDYEAADSGIYAVFPQRKHLALRVRMLIDVFKNTFGNPAYW